MQAQDDCMTPHAVDRKQQEEKTKEEPEGPTSAFGWDYCHDTSRELRYWVHSYTGEIKLDRHAHETPATRSVCKPSSADTSQNSELKQPAFVLLPSGVAPISPIENVFEAADAGYTKYPLRKAGEIMLRQYTASRQQIKRVMRTGKRLLPPTWENSPHGSPFLSGFPVEIFDPAAMSTGVTHPAQSSQWSMFLACATASRQPHPVAAAATNWTGYAISRSTHVNGQKEHNRRGYTIRQARKLLKSAQKSGVMSSVHSHSVLPADLRIASDLHQCAPFPPLPTTPCS